MEQVYFLYEQCRKRELDEDRINAIILANALVYTSVSYDKSSVTKKQNNWDNFLDSLDWRKTTKKKEKRASTFLKPLMMSGNVPIIGLDTKEEEKK